VVARVTGPAPTGFIVELFEGSETSPTDTRNRPEDATKAAFGNLKQGTEYTISVKARNKVKGAAHVASDAVTVTATTKAPPGAVTNLTASKTGGTWIVVTWNAPDPAPTGSYSVELFEGSDTSSTDAKNRPGDATKVAFDNLKPGTEYTISVEAKNKDKGAGLIEGAAATVTATTKAPPGAVTNLSIKKVTSNSMEAHWDAPDPAPTAKYIVELFKGSETSPTATQNKSMNATSATFTGLEAATSYKVSVKAQNEDKGADTIAGAAATATASTKATGSGLPNKPPTLDVAVAYNSSDSSKYTMTITWGEPANGGKAITKYYVVIMKLGEWDRANQEYTRDRSRADRAETTPSSRTHTYADGEVDVDYEVKVRAVNSEGKGPWATYQLSVSPKPSTG